MIQQDVGFLVNRFVCLSPLRRVASVLLSWLPPDFYLESPMALVSKPGPRPAVTRATPTTIICSANEPADWQLCEWNGLSPSWWKQCGVSPSSDWRWEDDKESVNVCLAYTRNLTWFQSNADSLYHLVTLICDNCCSNTLRTFWYSLCLPFLDLISALQILIITSEPLIRDLIFVEHGPSSFIAAVLEKLIQ